MGRIGKIKPLRTSAKDSYTRCGTIVKVLTFYAFCGCNPCRKPHKKAPKDIRRKFAESWKHEVELGTDIPLTPVVSTKLHPSPAEIGKNGEVQSVELRDEDTGEYCGLKSRPQKVIEGPGKRGFKDCKEQVKKAIRKATMRGEPSNAHSTSLNDSTPEEREWMFFAPESANHMRAIRQQGNTWFTSEDGTGLRKQVSRNHSARAAREEAEWREKESNGREKWNIRERVILDGDFFRGTNIWVAFCMVKPGPSKEDLAREEIAQGNVEEGDVVSSLSETGNAGSTCKGKNRSTSPRPPPLPTWPMAGSYSRTLITSSSPDTSSFRRHSGDTTGTGTTGTTGVTTPDVSPLLKEAMESPLPVTPMTLSPVPSVFNMTLADYFPILTLQIEELQDSEVRNPETALPEPPVLGPGVTEPVASAKSLMDILKDSKNAYKPHLVWEQWRARKQSALQASREDPVVLAEFGKTEPADLLPTNPPKRSGSVLDWRPWPQQTKKPKEPKEKQTDLLLFPSAETKAMDSAGKGEGKREKKQKEENNKKRIVTKEEKEQKIIAAAREKGFKMPWKHKGKKKAAADDRWEVHHWNGDLWLPRRPWKHDICREEYGSKLRLYKVKSFDLVLSATNGGVSGSRTRGTEEYERRKMGLAEWSWEEWQIRKMAMEALIEEGRKNCKGTEEWERKKGRWRKFREPEKYETEAGNDRSQALIDEKKKQEWNARGRC